MTRHRNDDGVAVIGALLLAGVLVVLTLALAIVGDLLAARQRAADTADLAALAGVSAVLPTPEEACASAAWVVRMHGATLRRCDLDGADVRVTVSVRPRGPWSRWLAAALGGVPEPTVSARAGRRDDLSPQR